MSRVVKNLDEVAIAITEGVASRFSGGVVKFLRGRMRIKSGKSTRVIKKDVNEKYSIPASDGVWKVWAKMIGGNFIVYCECPGGIVYDQVFLTAYHNKYARRDSLPVDRGHKVLRTPRLDELERGMP